MRTEDILYYTYHDLIEAALTILSRRNILYVFLQLFFAERGNNLRNIRVV
jgi:hypothetical protein